MTRVSTYALSGRSVNVSEVDERPLGFASLDIDQKLIHPLHVSKHAFATDTTLAAELVPGATSLVINDASGWSNDPWESADTRSLAWYGYADSTGHMYPDYSYTRNVAFDFDDGLWEPGAIRYDQAAGTYRIRLREPWSGPTLAAGAAVRNATSGQTLNRPRVSPPFERISTYKSFEYAVTIGGGEWQDGQRSDEAFRPGTAFIQPVFASTAPWTDVVIGPEPVVVDSLPLEAGENRQVSLDLDVLGKGALGAAIGPFVGDYNRSGVVDAPDYTVWRNSLGDTGLAPFSGADGNGDGEINQVDYQVWRSNYGSAVTVEIDSLAQPQHGTATIVAGAGPGGRDIVHYRSAPWFVGTDVVTYTLKNTATNETLMASVTIHVLGGNHEQDAALTTILANQASVVVGNVAPTAQFDSFYVTAAGQSLDVDGAHALNLLTYISDPVDVLVVRLLSGPTHGTLSLKYDGTFEYAPAAGFSGVDTFRYEAFDGLYHTAAVATITVLDSADDLVQDRLKRLGLGMLNYVDSFNRFPVINNASYFDGNGNPYLSWRVHLLPYLGYQSLYAQFHLNEPWNSPNNLPLVDKMPDLFRNAGDAASSTTTRFQIISGEGVPYYWRRLSSLLVGPRSNDFTDGVSDSLLVIESGADQAVTWTKPDDLEFDPNDPLAALGTISSGKINAVMADGAPIVLSASIDPTTFKSLVTISGGEIVDANTVAPTVCGSSWRHRLWRRQLLQSNCPRHAYLS